MIFARLSHAFYIPRYDESRDQPPRLQAKLDRKPTTDLVVILHEFDLAHQPVLPTSTSTLGEVHHVGSGHVAV